MLIVCLSFVCALYSVCQININHVSDFKYLGSKMASSASDLKRCTCKALAWSAFWELKCRWRSSKISVKTKVKLFNSAYMTILLYGRASLMISQDMESKINAFAISCYRIILIITRTDHVPNATINAMAGSEPLIHCVRSRQLRFLGHILHLPPEEPARRYALYIPQQGRRPDARPGGMLQEDQIAALANDRSAWRTILVACSRSRRMIMMSVCCPLFLCYFMSLC